MKRLIFVLLAAFSLYVPALPAAAQIQGQVVSVCGTNNQTPPAKTFSWLTLDPTGVLCTNASGGGGGSASFTAAPSPYAVTAGTSKPAGISTTNSALWTIPVKPGTTTEIDLTAPSGVFGVDGATIATLANAFPTLTVVNDGTTNRVMSGTTSGAIAPPTNASGKETQTEVSLTTAINTTLAAANTNRIGIEIQCNGGPVKVSTVGATLTSSAMGTGPAGTRIPTTDSLYTQPISSLTAITGYQSTGSTVICTVTEYNK